MRDCDEDLEGEMKIATLAALLALIAGCKTAQVQQTESNLLTLLNQAATLATGDCATKTIAAVQACRQEMPK